MVKKQLRCNKLMEFLKNLPPCLIGMEAAPRRIIGRAN